MIIMARTNSKIPRDLMSNLSNTNNLKEKPTTKKSLQCNIQPTSLKKTRVSSSAVESVTIKRPKIESNVWVENKASPKAMIGTIFPATAVESTGEDTFKRDILALLEDQFTCCICEEIMVKVTMTKCKHFFCAYCLQNCKIQRKICPMCRTPRMLERSIDFLDEYISKMMKLVSEDLYARRLELIKEREEKRTHKITRRTIG